ncbi:MAG: LysR family transcriptional regulator [Parachlamydiaceae bacterium]|nr:LysR family transcriptional regulator [Parachlamydiaceae bacterium]
MINPVWLVSFIEVVNRASMADDARHLRITPAAVSKHILSLENGLGIQLLRRSTRRIDLTHEGALYFEHAKLILEAYQQAEAAVSHSKEEPSGLLKFVCGPQIGNLYVIPYLKEFLERYPKLRLHIELTQTMPDLEKEKIDVVVGLTAGVPVHCIQRTLTHSRWVFCASPEYLKKYGIPKKPADLTQHRIITRIQRQPNNLIEFETGESVPFEPYLYFNDTRAIRRSVLHGLGMAQLHDYIIADDIKENRLVEILSKYTEQKKTIPIHISYFPATHVHVKIRKFLDFMVEIAARLH